VVRCSLLANFITVSCLDFLSFINSSRCSISKQIWWNYKQGEEPLLCCLLTQVQRRDRAVEALQAKLGESISRESLMSEAQAEHHARLQASTQRQIMCADYVCRLCVQIVCAGHVCTPAGKYTEEDYVCKSCVQVMSADCVCRSCVQLMCAGHVCRSCVHACRQVHKSRLCAHKLCVRIMCARLQASTQRQIMCAKQCVLDKPVLIRNRQHLAKINTVLVPIKFLSFVIGRDFIKNTAICSIYLRALANPTKLPHKKWLANV
jgi:hypothetical protein